MIPTHAGALMPHPVSGGAVATGWANPVDSAAGAIARANTGTYTVEFLGEIFEFLDFYAGIVDYTSGTVAWSLVWVPVAGAPAPTKTELAGGVVRLRFANQDYPFQNIFNGLGLATLTATLDAQPTDAGVEIAVSDGEFGYGAFAWQPVP